MEYTANINLKTSETEKIIKLFATEDNKFQNRSEYSIRKERHGITFDITANDAVSLRAAINAIIKTLIIFEKSKLQ